MPNHDEVLEIDVRTGASFFRQYEHFDLREWYCFGEYIDNAIGSMEKNLKALKKADPEFVLTVRIYRDPSEKKIYITDNAAGISDADLARAFWVGERPEDTTGAHEYGVGMKMASFFFCNRWSVRTSALGEAVEKTIILDVDELESNETTVIDVIRDPKSAELHHTEIILESFYPDNWPAGKTISKVKTFLSSMYRNYIDAGKLILIFNDGDLGLDEPLSGSFPEVLNMPFTKTPDDPSKLWKEDISFEYKDKKITGWVGLLAETSQMKAGFDLIRRNKVISGDENSWKPDGKDSADFNIFDGGHSNARSRLFGELVFTGFKTDSNKSRIIWGNDGECKEEFLKYLYALIKLDPTIALTVARNERLKDFWYQLENYVSFKRKEEKGIEKVIATSQSVISAKLAMDHAEWTFPDLAQNETSSNEPLAYDDQNDLESFEFVINETVDRSWNVKVIPTEGDGQNDWFSYDAKPTPNWPKEIEIRWDRKHPYSLKVFKIGEDSSIYQILAPEIFRLIAYLVIGEEKLSSLGREKIDDFGRSFYRDFVNKSLKLTSSK